MKKLVSVLVILLAAGVFTGCGKNEHNDNCGNGKKDSGEFCDPKIPAGNEGACPTKCAAGKYDENLSKQCKDPCVLPPYDEKTGIGAACKNGTDCAEGLVCQTEDPVFQIYKGGMCLKDEECQDSKDCDAGSLCIEIKGPKGKQNICLKKCNLNDPKPCRDGYTCVTPSRGDGNGVCIFKEEDTCDPASDTCNDKYKTDPTYCDQSNHTDPCIISECKKLSPYNKNHCIEKAGSNLKDAKDYAKVCKDKGQCGEVIAGKMQCIRLVQALVDNKGKIIQSRPYETGMCTLQKCTDDAECQTAYSNYAHKDELKCVQVGDPRYPESKACLIACSGVNKKGDEECQKILGGSDASCQKLSQGGPVCVRVPKS